MEKRLRNLPNQLKKRLRQSSIAVLPTDGEVKLEIVDDLLNKRILSLNSDGRISEYELNYRVSYRVKGKNNSEWGQLINNEVRRQYTYDDENVVGLNFFQAIQTCLKKYFIIKGRASRSEYWYFQLLFSPIAFYAGFWSDPVSTGMWDPPPFYLISVALLVLLFIPAVTSQVRRFHDKDKSGWFILINLIPFVGWIIVLVICIDKGTAGKNRFGQYPLKANN